MRVVLLFFILIYVKRFESVFVISGVIRSADVFEVHGLKFTHDLLEEWPLVGVFVPASLHQVKEWARGVPF